MTIAGIPAMVTTSPPDAGEYQVGDHLGGVHRMPGVRDGQDVAGSPGGQMVTVKCGDAVLDRLSSSRPGL